VSKPAPQNNTITLRTDGPLICQGSFTLLSVDGGGLAHEEELYLCRCGASRKAPFCDGSHKRIGFVDDAQFEDERCEELDETCGQVTITCRTDAMYVIKGPVTIQSEDGRSVTRRSRAALCRCGASGKKPFCDTSHKLCGHILD
jgi:CDGSH-type Zn-finger protein